MRHKERSYTKILLKAFSNKFPNLTIFYRYLYLIYLQTTSKRLEIYTVIDNLFKKSFPT